MSLNKSGCDDALTKFIHSGEVYYDGASCLETGPEQTSYSLQTMSLPSCCHKKLTDFNAASLHNKNPNLVNYMKTTGDLCSEACDDCPDYFLDHGGACATSGGGKRYNCGRKSSIQISSLCLVPKKISDNIRM